MSINWLAVSLRAFSTSVLLNVASTSLGTLGRCWQSLLPGRLLWISNSSNGRRLFSSLWLPRGAHQNWLLFDARQPSCLSLRPECVSSLQPSARPTDILISALLSRFLAWIRRARLFALSHLSTRCSRCDSSLEFAMITYFATSDFPTSPLPKNPKQ